MRLATMVLLIQCAAVLVFASRQSTGQPSPFIDISLTVVKPKETCACETTNRIAFRQPDGSSDSGSTPGVWFDFCIWEVGRRQERRRLHAMLRGREGWRTGATGNTIAIANEVERVLAMSQADLRRELE